ncbi:hypothetical protein SEEHN189_06070 [Salmonella enterica subsp. enterica serovar Heidelberg str. N189]|nr:hypothetical protein SEEHN189_06070 [Salmonella enterica subsp. enterica serovar Heidelberg str. N189]
MPGQSAILGIWSLKFLRKRRKKEPQPLYTFSLPLLSVQDEIRVYCKKKNIKIGYDTLFMEITFSADREAVDELIKHFFTENKLYLRGRFYLSAAVV